MSVHSVKSTYQKLAGLIVLLASLLSCRPVFAIGWTELVILLVLITILLGPVLLKVYRALDKIRKADKDENHGIKRGK